MATIKKSGLEVSDFAKRFKDFRITIIDEVQMRAVEKMNITRGFFLAWKVAGNDLDWI
jgi:hypothetical protein